MFIYDIFLNFNKELYDFYDWKESDDIDHIRKIPLLRISNELYNLLISNNVKINIKDISFILNKTEIYNKNKIKKINYSFIGSTGINSIAILLDNEGNIIKRSQIELEDELEISDIALSLKEIKINYEKLNNVYNFKMLTRDNEEILNNIIGKIKQNQNNNDALKYLYYEWNNKEYEGNNCYDDLIKTIKTTTNDKIEDFINILNLIKNV